VNKYFIFTLTVYFSIFALGYVDHTSADQISLSTDVPAKAVTMVAEIAALKLIGTVVSDNSCESLAVIEDGNTGDQYRRHEGERIGEKVAVKKILRNRVIIEANGSAITLVMGHAHQQEIPPAYYREAGLPVPASTRLYANIIRGQDLSVFLPNSYDRKDVDNYFQNIEAWKKAHVQPAEDDAANGFVLSFIHPGSVPWRMGLRSGDTIRSVNGEIISNPKEADRFFNIVRKGGEVRIEVEREKESRELRIYVPAAPLED
jgi:type II secretion system protein C